MATSRTKKPVLSPQAPSLRDLTSLRSQRKRKSPSPSVQSPTFASTEEKLRTVTTEWTHIKKELQRRALVSRSANVSMSESSSFSSSHLQGKKLVDVIKASSSPEPSLRSPRHEVLTGRSGNILFKKKTISPIRTERVEGEEKMLSKAMQYATTVSEITKSGGRNQPDKKSRCQLTFIPSPVPRARNPLLLSYTSRPVHTHKRSLLTADSS